MKNVKFISVCMAPVATFDSKVDSNDTLNASFEAHFELFLFKLGTVRIEKA